MTLLSLRTVVAITLMLVLASLATGYPWPFDTSSPQQFVVDLPLFAGALYLVRTLIRLPIAITLMIRFTIQARHRRGMSRRESVLDGFYRGFLDRRRWAVGQLALLDRLVLLCAVWLSVTPVVGTLLVKIGGLIGVALMLVVYLMGGTFSFLVDDSSDGQNRLSLPFLNLRRGEQKPPPR
jgi:hypothetical protein